MNENSALLPVIASIVIINIIALALGWRRITYRNYYFTTFVIVVVCFVIAFIVHSSFILWSLFGGQFFFLTVLSVRNLFFPLDREFNLVSRIIATLGVACIILALILHHVAQRPFGYG